MSKKHMKISALLALAAATTLLLSCEKPAVTEAERNAQVEREVQARLAAERQTADQQRLAQQAAELDARERALADKEADASRPRATVPAATAAPRERTVTTTRSTRTEREDRAAPRSYDTFYRKLEPYGAWRQSETYGYVFQPREARARNWRPYTNGRWTYTDAGWTWISDEPFGWATYHYGRWTRMNDIGWVWVPGEEWAPAWVSWRTGGDHVGWAPLPPEARFEKRTGIKKWADSYYDIDADEYVFIPDEDIGAENIQRYVVPQERNVTIVNQTTNVTNITYNNTTVVNEGPNYDELRGRSRRPLERMRLQREYDVQQEQSPGASVTAGVVAMMTPLFTARSAERPRTEGAMLRGGRAERVQPNERNNPAAEQARMKMRAEATPPPDAPSKRYEKPEIPENAPTVAPQPAAAATAAPTATPAASAAPAITPTPASTPLATPTPTPRLHRRHQPRRLRASGQPRLRRQRRPQPQWPPPLRKQPPRPSPPLRRPRPRLQP